MVKDETAIVNFIEFASEHFLHGDVTPQRPPAKSKMVDRPSDLIFFLQIRLVIVAGSNSNCKITHHWWKQKKIEILFHIFQLLTHFCVSLNLESDFFRVWDVRYFFPRSNDTWYRKNNNKVCVATVHTRRLIFCSKPALRFYRFLSLSETF